ncbi:HNH endonuclease [Pelagibacteraceae bacterium]|nr:HNH endonuclease [Pelagibacteraceae bacterium]
MKLNKLENLKRQNFNTFNEYLNKLNKIGNNIYFNKTQKIKSKKINEINNDQNIYNRKRTFSKRQRLILKILSGNKCSKCAKKLTIKFHADHIIPYSKEGKTNLNNGQALCETCNLKKGDSYG